VKFIAKFPGAGAQTESKAASITNQRSICGNYDGCAAKTEGFEKASPGASGARGPIGRAESAAGHNVDYPWRGSPRAMKSVIKRFCVP
jgi:hypothetical protein